MLLSFTFLQFFCWVCSFAWFPGFSSGSPVFSLHQTQNTKLNSICELSVVWLRGCFLKNSLPFLFRATEIRRRQRQEKKEKTEKLVKDIKDRVQHEESTRWIRKIIKNSLIVIGVCAAAYIAYRCYRYFYRIPRRKFRRF